MKSKPTLRNLGSFTVFGAKFFKQTEQRRQSRGVRAQRALYCLLPTDHIARCRPVLSEIYTPNRLAKTRESHKPHSRLRNAREARFQNRRPSANRPDDVCSTLYLLSALEAVPRAYVQFASARLYLLACTQTFGPEREGVHREGLACHTCRSLAHTYLLAFNVRPVKIRLSLIQTRKSEIASATSGVH